jgi:hypothetical protein
MIPRVLPKKIFVLSAFGAVDKLQDLPFLDEEYERIESIYQSLALEKNLGIVGYCSMFSDRNKLIEKIQQFQRNLTIFHFSGHADKASFWFRDKQAYIKGLAKILRNCENLKLIFLNGCSTNGQVRDILDAHQKAVVIGTYSLIGDQKAKNFSIQFFKALMNEGKSIKDAFEDAVAYIESIDDQIRFKRAGRKELDIADENNSEWGIFYEPQSTEFLNWTISTDYLKLIDEATKKEFENMKKKVQEQFSSHHGINLR